MTPDPSGGPSVGDVGGVFAGVVAAMIALGHGLRWWLGWSDRRASTRTAKLDAWQRELEGREQRLDGEQRAYWATVQAELETLRSEHAALLTAYQLLAAALTRHDPGNEALRQANDVLRSAFPLKPRVPVDMNETLGRIKRTGEE
jgi:hypothetical protein